MSYEKWMLKQKFFDVLFEPEEFICLSDGKMKGTDVIKLSDARRCPDAGAFAINPLRGDGDNNPTEVYHAYDVPRRADANVTVFRNILIENDQLSLEEQVDLVKQRGMPYSTRVYSGGKSYHWIISLKEPCKSRDEYDALVRRVYKAMPEADPANKNPSRLSRFPNSVRADKGTVQELIEVSDRVSMSELTVWLEARGIPEVEHAPKSSVMKSTGYTTETGRLSPWARYFLFNGAPDGRFNLSLYGASRDACIAGYSEEDWIELLIQFLPSGHLDTTDRRTIREAFKRGPDC